MGEWVKRVDVPYVTNSIADLAIDTIMFADICKIGENNPSDKYR